MKIITIGRGEGSTIQIDNEFISRQHALLRLYPSGKVELIDKSSNGTAINGRTMKPNTPYRVRRKDVVTFAGQAQLVWSDVPDPLRPWKIAGICLVVILAILGGLYAFKDKLKKKPETIQQGAVPVMQASSDPTPAGEEAQPPKEEEKKAETSPKEDKLRKAMERERKANKQKEDKKKQEEPKKEKSDTSNMSLF